MPMYPSGMHRLQESMRSGSVYDAATTAYFAAMTTQPDATRKGLLATLVKAIEAAGLFSKLDWLNILAMQDPSQAVVNMINPAKKLQQVGTGTGLSQGGTWTTDRGWSGNGTDGYLSYQETLGAGGKFGLNSATIGIWWNGTGVNGANLIGTVPTSNNHLNYVNGSSLNARLGNGTTGSSVTFANEHHLAAVRTDSTTLGFYANGSFKGNSSSAVVSDGAVSSNNGSVGAARGTFTTMSIAASYSGAGLNSTDMTNLHNALSAYLTAIGAQ